MKIVKFKGGLGNQLFQYAFLCNLEESTTDMVKADFQYFKYTQNDTIRKPRLLDLKIKLVEASNYDISELRYFHQTSNYTTFKYKMSIGLECLLNQQYFFEINYNYHNISQLLKYKYFDGYWQSWHYVDNVATRLRYEIQPKFKLSEKTRSAKSTILFSNAVFVGIRRGDYFSSPKEKRLYDVIDNEYYERATNYIKKNINNPVFYVFSNDITWVKENLNLTGTVIYREAEEQFSDLEELFLMASCKHAIISNSTYYWWGAWLIDNSDKIVIAPQKWFGTSKQIDIIPDKWIQM